MQQVRLDRPSDSPNVGRDADVRQPACTTPSIVIVVA
jgi:hypothetical protein